jgi:signal recognition particle subunit SRP19
MLRTVSSGFPISTVLKSKGSQLYRHIASQLQQAQPTLKYTKNAPKPKPLAIAAAPLSGKKAKKAKASGSNSKKASSSTAQAKSKGKGKRVFPPPMVRPSIHQPSQPLPHIDDRLPLHSPVIATGIAVSAVKREVEQAKEAKANASSTKALEGSGPGPGLNKDGKPKMKKMVVRGKR